MARDAALSPCRVTVWGVKLRSHLSLAGACGVVALMSSASSAQQAGLASDAAAFGAREAASNMDLSPDGNRVVYVGPGPGRASIIFVADLTTGNAKAIGKSTADPEVISWCAFAGNDR